MPAGALLIELPQILAIGTTQPRLKAPLTARA